MSETINDAKDRIRRSINSEFIRMEDDFDETRKHRSTIIDKLMETVSKVNLIDDTGKIVEENEPHLNVIKTALKAISDVEKSTAIAIGLKLKNQEQEIASNNATKERIAIVLRATAPGRIDQDFPAHDLEAHLEEMFESDIKDFELKSNPRDISE